MRFFAHFVSKKSWLRLALLLPFAVGAMMMFILLIHYGVNTPFWDQWEMVPLFQKVDAHTLGIIDLWRQHNEHRVLFPNILLLISAYATHWHTGIEILMGLFFAMISAVLLFLMLRRSIKSTWLGLLAGTILSAWFFSPVQWENWMWGWQVEWFMCIAALLGTIYLLLRFIEAKGQKNRTILFCMSVITAVLATYTLGGGQLIWVLGLIILLVTKQRKKPLISWGIATVLTLGLYYFNYAPTPSPGGSPMHVVAHHPISFIQFFLTYMGGPVGASPGLQTAMLIFGSIFVLALAPLLYMVWCDRRNIKIYLPWLTLMLLGLLCGLSTAYSRLGYGIGFAASSRYTAFSSLYLIGSFALLFTMIDHKAKLTFEGKRLAVTTLAVLVIPLLVSSYAVGIKGFSDHSKLLKRIQSCTQSKHPSDACLLLTYPDSKIVAPRLDYLKSRHWAGY